MVFARAELTAAERADLAADRPLLASGPGLEDAIRLSWRTSGSLSSGGDVTARGAPAAAGGDWMHHCCTRPRSNGVGLVHYFVAELAGATIDAAAVLTHNGAQLGGVVGWRIDFGDDAAFASSETVALWTSQLDRRLVSVTLGAGNPGVLVGARYSNVQHVRLRIAYNGSAPHPEFGELLLLQRWQMARRPDVPHVERLVQSRAESFTSYAGAEHAVTHYRGRAALEAVWPVVDEPSRAGWRAWHARMRHGADPFLYIPRPSSDVRRAYVMRLESPQLLASIDEDPELGEVRIAALEQAPFYAGEVGE